MSSYQSNGRRTRLSPAGSGGLGSRAVRPRLRLRLSPKAVHDKAQRNRLNGIKEEVFASVYEQSSLQEREQVDKMITALTELPRVGLATAKELFLSVALLVGEYANDQEAEDDEARSAGVLPRSSLTTRADGG